MQQGLLILAALLALPATPPVDDATRITVDRGGVDVRAALLDLGAGTRRGVWDVVHRLQTASESAEGAANLAALVDDDSFPTLPRPVRFAAATLVRLTSKSRTRRERALTTLLKIARPAPQDSPGNTPEDPLRLDAIRLLGEAREIERVRGALSEILDAARAQDRPRALIATVLALDRLDSTTPRLPVQRLLRDATRGFDVRAEAALALARMTPRESVHPLVVPMLRRLSREPSQRGSLARLLIDRLARDDGQAPELVRQLDDLERENERLTRRVARLTVDGSSDGSGRGAIHDLLGLIRQQYVDPGKVIDEELAIQAFEALAAHLDHVRFLSPAEVERQRARSLGWHLGLGAAFFKLDRNSPLVVVRVLVPPPSASSAERLHTGDRILAIDGIATIGRNPDDIRRQLRAKQAGSRVDLEIERWGWDEPRSVGAQHGVIDAPTVFHQLFPMRIGFVRIARFGERSAADFADAIADLEASAGAELAGLILDLRDNSGGLLEQAVKVVDQFVGDGSVPIVTQHDRAGRPAREYLPTASRAVDCPVVVVINRWTASSAEVVAGALQDFQRATVVGRRSYGKGVSQQRYTTPKSVNRAVGGEAGIVLPNYFLQLPSGRRYHLPRDARGRPVPGRQGGIVPDVEADHLEDTFQGWELDEFLRVQYSVELYRYVKANYANLKSHWEEGARDLLNPNNYPDFDDVYLALGTRLDEEQVRIALRGVFRRHLEDESERDLAQVIHEDSQLQRALRVLGIGRHSSPLYAKWLPETAEDE